MKTVFIEVQYTIAMALGILDGSRLRLQTTFLCTFHSYWIVKLLTSATEITQNGSK